MQRERGSRVAVRDAIEGVLGGTVGETWPQNEIEWPQNVVFALDIIVDTCMARQLSGLKKIYPETSDLNKP